MSKRSKKDPQAWRRTKQGIDAYKVVKDQAQANADAMKREVGLEANDLFQSWRWFHLPNPENRTGYELRCEIVRPAKLGPAETRGLSRPG